MSFLFFRYFIGTLFFCIVIVSANIATGEREILTIFCGGRCIYSLFSANIYDSFYTY